MDPSPVMSEMTPHLWLTLCGLVGDPDAEDPTQQGPDSGHTETENLINVCCFMLLRFGIMSYAALEK